MIVEHRETKERFIIRNKYQDSEGRGIMYKLSRLDKPRTININEDIFNQYFNFLKR